MEQTSGVISHWINEERQKCFSVDALAEKLGVLDSEDIKNIKLLFENDTSGEYNDIRIQVLENIISLNKTMLSDGVINTLWKLNEHMSKRSKTKGGFVYIAKTNEDGVYKIGKAGDIKKREQTLRIGNRHLQLFAYTYSANPIKLEALLHNIYYSSRISGEWFYLDNDTLREIILQFCFSIAINDKVVSK